MINTSNRCLLMIEPKSKVKEQEVNDSLTKFVEDLMETAVEGTCYRGFHICACGAFSGSCDLYVTINGNKYLTNSLAVHYMKYHRSEVPESEIEKLKV